MYRNTVYTPFLTELSLSSFNAWVLIVLFVIGNIVLPQLAHLVPGGGLIFLPIYFFTLVAAYKYGWKVGLLTAIVSPVVNSLMFGMPVVHNLPIIIFKGVLLALCAALAAKRFNKVSLLILVGVVLAYQILGCAVESFVLGDFYAGIQDFRIGCPGMLIQIFGGFALIKCLRL